MWARRRYKYLFNASRMPKMPTDEYITYDPTFYHHIIAVRKNQFYKVDGVVDGWELSTDQIRRSIAQCHLSERWNLLDFGFALF